MTKSQQLQETIRAARLKHRTELVREIATTTIPYEKLAQEWGYSSQFVYKLAAEYGVRRHADKRKEPMKSHDPDTGAEVTVDTTNYITAADATTLDDLSGSSVWPTVANLIANQYIDADEEDKHDREAEAVDE